MSTLEQFGWTAQTEQQSHEHNPDNHQPARIVRVDRGLLTVVTEDGDRRLPLSSRLRKSASVPAVGDWALVTDDHVTGLLPRQNALVRQDTDGSAVSQVIAANVDLVVVAIPLTEGVRVRKLERYVAFARTSGAEALVVLTKRDLCADVPAAVADATTVAGGAEVHAVSARGGEGLDALVQHLAPGRTVVLVGPSGAGKSTLANALGAEREQATGDIRDDGKGRHTTTAREMLLLREGALLIDTPGLRSLSLWDAEDGIASTFADVAELADGCRFRDCTHRTEPGCAVNAAVLDGRLTGDRVDGFAKLRKEEERLAAKVDSRLRAERNRELRAFHRSLRDQPSR